MRTAWQDLRFAVRMLIKRPGFTLVAVVTLALGIGANTAMFSVLNTYLFRTLPYPDSNRLVRVFRTSPHSQSWPHSVANFFDHRERNDVFESMAAFTWISPNLAEAGQPAERLRGLAATADFLPMLGVQPALGRAFNPEEFEPGANKAVVLSHSLWMRRFGGDPHVVGETLRLNGDAVTIVGVMPPAFEHPLLWGNIDLWSPLVFSPEERRSRDRNYLQSFGRLKPGVSIARAQQEMAALAANLSDETHGNIGESLRLEPLQQSMSDEIGRKVMWFTFGLAGFVLLIACTNLANLQLVRTAGRAREYAIRAALGAARRRLLRQSLTESLAVSLAGGVRGLVIALWGVGFISGRLFGDLAGVAVTVDLRVFGFALLASVLTGLIFGSIPAWLASRVDLSQALRENSRGSTAGRSQHRLRHGLIVGEVAFALVLLAGASLFLRGLQRFANLDPGWRVDGLTIAHVRMQGSGYATDAQLRSRLQQIEERAAALPGIQRVGLSLSEPIYSFNSSGPFRVQDQPVPEPGRWPETFFESVSTDYFDALGIRLLAGRTFTSSDGADRPDVVIINETLARHFWPDESAIGKRIGTGEREAHWQEVVGVVGDVGFPGSLDEPYTRFQCFRPLAQATWGGGWTLELRSSRPPESLENDLRQAVSGLDSDLPVFEIRSARSRVENGMGSISLLGTLLGGFAALGFALAAIGIYGVTSYSTVQRTGEIGIRMALGARQHDVLWLVLGKGARLIVVGSAIGLGGAYAVGQLLAAAIPTLPTRDPVTLAIVTALLVGVALLACYIPARRATKVDPMVALRHE